MLHHFDRRIAEWRESAGAQWVNPHVVCTQDELTFEWWREWRCLSVFYAPGDNEGFRSPKDINDTSVRFNPDDCDQRRDAWLWMMGDLAAAGESAVGK